MATRKGKKDMKYMMGGNSVWRDPVTKTNQNKIIHFLVQRKYEAENFGKFNPEFSYSQISKYTGINPHQVSKACWLLAFEEDSPLIRITAKSYGTKEGGKTTEKVRLIRLPR